MIFWQDRQLMSKGCIELSDLRAGRHRGRLP
jgi:hypothetical protein